MPRDAARLRGALNGSLDVRSVAPRDLADGNAPGADCANRDHESILGRACELRRKNPVSTADSRTNVRFVSVVLDTLYGRFERRHHGPGAVARRASSAV
jgi:hypothetical protein